MSIIDRVRKLLGGGGMDAGEGMIPCEEALRFIHEFLDGELPDAPRERVKRHFDACTRCYPHLHLEKSFREAVRRAAAGEVAPPELRDRVLDLLHRTATEG